MADNKQPYVIAFPFPSQGHINPALEFSKCLASHGLKVTIILTTMVGNSAKVPPNSLVNVETISDGSEDVKEPETLEGFFKRFKAAASNNLAKFIQEQRETNCAPKVLVYDSTMPWALDVAHQQGIPGASFFTQASGVNAVYYHIYTGLIKFPYEDYSEVSLPSMPPLGLNDLPCFSFLPDQNNTTSRLLADQFSNLDEADWIFINTFDKLESEILEWMKSRWPFKTVGPTLLLVKLLNEKKHKINLFEPNYEESVKWLDSRENGSVVYVSFGSVASLKEEQMQEVAEGLIKSDCNFLWVVRASEENKLPKNFITSIKASEKGLVVNWCPQTEVLAHRVVGCFMTHCGWNSMLEGMCYGVPLIAMGQWVDQTTNAKLVEDLFKVGIRVKVDENGLARREEIDLCIKQVIQGEKGKKLKETADMWKEWAKRAVDKGGSSATNVEEFVSKLFNL